MLWGFHMAVQRWNPVQGGTFPSQMAAMEPSLPLHKCRLGTHRLLGFEKVFVGLIKHWAHHQVLTGWTELLAAGCAPAAGDKAWVHTAFLSVSGTQCRALELGPADT